MTRGQIAEEKLGYASHRNPASSAAILLKRWGVKHVERDEDGVYYYRESDVDEAMNTSRPRTGRPRKDGHRG